MIGAGDRNVRVRFERAITVEDEYTSSTKPSWTAYAMAWAAVRYGTGTERREAAQTASSMPATITVLANTRTRGLTTKDRVIIAGGVWDISGVVPSPDRATVAVTAVRGQDE